MEETDVSMKIVWGITGSGDLMPEVFRVMSGCAKSMDCEITVVLSTAAVKVVKWYKLWDELHAIGKKVLIEEDANSPFIVGPLQTGAVDCFLVAPTTANTVAKIVHGIADTIITNAVAQTNKTSQKVFVLPVDQEPGTTITTLPGGAKLELTMRETDIENSRRLARMDGIQVISKPEEIASVLERCPGSISERSF